MDNFSKTQYIPLKTLKSALFVGIIFIGIIISQAYSDLERTQLSEPLNILPTQLIQLTDLGLHSAASSLLWIYTVQQLLAHKSQVPQLIESVTALDPRFSYPYAFSALVLPEFEMEDEGIKIAEKGIRDADPDWRIPFYMATTYHIYGKEREKAAFYFDLASRTENAPDGVKLIASRYGIQKDIEQTKAIWESIYETSDDEIIKERAKNYLTHINMAELLSKALKIFHERYRREPINIQELVSKKILLAIPVSPLGVRFEIEKGRIIVF